MTYILWSSRQFGWVSLRRTCRVDRGGTWRQATGIWQIQEVEGRWVGVLHSRKDSLLCCSGVLTSNWFL